MKHTQKLGLLLLLVCLGACQKPPQPSPDVMATAAQPQPLPNEVTATVFGIAPPIDPTVTFALPSSEVAVDTPIVLAFSEPMVPLTAVDLAATASAVTVTPDVPLRWRWVATDTLVGEPQPGWPHATPLHVHMAPLTTRAGRLMRQGLDWDFQTAPPQLLWTAPQEGEAFAPRNSRVALLLDQPVDLTQLREHLTVTSQARAADDDPLAESETPLAFQAALADAKTLGDAIPPDLTGQLVALSFAQKLPPWQRVTVTVTPGMRGKAGTLATIAAQSLTFGTAGGAADAASGALEPFALLQVDGNTDADPDTWQAATLEFTTAIAPADQTRLLKATPPIKDLRLSCYDTRCTIHGEFAPATTYTLTLSPQFEDAHGRHLGKPIVLTRSFGHRTPQLNIDTDGTVMELQQKPHAVAITLRNLNHVTARAFVVPPQTPYAVVHALRESDPGYAAALASLGKPIELPIKATQKPDTIERRVVDLDAALAGRPGRVWLEVVTPDITRLPDQRWAPSGKEGRLFQVTDLHIAAKVAENESLFWVTSLQTGQPIAGARVELQDENDEVVWREATNADGLTTGPGGLTWQQRKKHMERRVTAQKDGDAVTLEVVEPSEWAAEDSGREDAERGWLFTDKPIYRQGETVQIKGLLRLVGKDGLSLPAAGREATLRLVDPFGHTATEATVRLSARGTFAAALALPTNGATGSWHVAAKSQNAQFGTTVQLAVYHVPRTRLDVALKAKQVARGDVVRGDVQASWFSGGPLEHAPTHVTASGIAEAFEPPGWPEFQFGVNAWQEDDAAGARNVLNHELRTTTDDRGRAQFQVPTGVAMDRSLHVEVAASVQDPNGRDMAASTAFWLHPAAALVGVALQSAFATAHAPLPVRLIASDPQGHALADLPIAVKLLRREWKAMRVHGMSGETSWETRQVTTPVGNCTVKSAALPVDCTLTLADAGLYALQVTVRDKQGRTALTTLDFYASGADMTWGPDAADQPLLIADKAAYKVGDVAHILVRNQAPNALALVTEERAGIQRTRLVKLADNATLDVPIEARHAPNVHIGVMAIAGRRGDGALGLDTGAPSLQMQAIELTVDPGEHRLQVVVTPEHKKALPGQKTTVEVAVKDTAGRPRAAEVTLWAVDEGVLSLTGEATPDPLTTLYAAIARGVEERALMDALVRRRAGELKGDAGGGGGEHGMTRSNLRDVAFWQAAIQLPADGKARHTFTLPDNLTTWRIMAVAIDGPGDFGSGDVQMEVAKPLMVQPALPRSVAVGDAVELTATLRNRQAFAVSVHAQLTLTGPLAIDGPGEATLTLAPQQSQEVRFRVKATAAGAVQVKWQAKATAPRQPDALDAVEEPLEVRTLQPLESVASWAQVTGNRVDVLRKDANVVADRGGLRVAVSRSLAAGMEGDITALNDYPYACTEQLTSRLQGQLALMQLRRVDPGALPAMTGDAKALAQTLIERIAARAQDRGGIALWDGGEAHFDATLWALWVLADVDRQALPLNEALLLRAVRWLRSHAPEDRQVQVLAVAAAVGATLPTAVELADPATAESFFAGRSQLGADDRLWLALALARLGWPSHKPQVLTLLEPLLADLRIDGETSYLPSAPSTWAWSSAVQRQAMLVELLTRVAPDHPLLPRLTRWLVRQQGGRGWGSTHETAWLLRALMGSLQGAAPTGTYAFAVAGQTLLSGPVKASLRVDTAEIPQAQLAYGDTRLQLDRQGQGPLWLRLTFSYALQTPPQEARNHGFLVRRRLFTVRGEPITGPLHRGDQVIVQLEVTAGDAWQDVAIVDRPAAGLEPIDLQFSNHDAGLAQRLAALQVDRHARLGWPTHTELAGREVRFFANLQPGTQIFRYVARAANRGRFLDPGARADAMYRPDVFGTTGASALSIE
jgi:uncharacterized protein YfaS (alpha-2-macroglobulin family)